MNNQAILNSSPKYDSRATKSLISVKKKKYLFILSPSFSGSTLLTILLAQHPCVSSLGELLGRHKRHFKNDGDFCSCGEKLDECSFLANLKNDLHDKYEIEFDPLQPITTLKLSNKFYSRLIGYPLHRQSSRRIAYRIITMLDSRFLKQVREVVECNATVMHEIMHKTNTGVYVDSSKRLMKPYYFNKFLHSNTFILLLSKNARGTIRSIMRNMSIDSVHSAAKLWKESMESNISLFNKFPEERRKYLSYERLCSNPTSALASIFDMLNLEQKRISNQIDPSQLHISGNRMSRKGKQIVKFDEKWKSQYTENELRFLEDYLYNTEALLSTLNT